MPGVGRWQSGVCRCYGCPPDTSARGPRKAASGRTGFRPRAGHKRVRGLATFALAQGNEGRRGNTDRGLFEARAKPPAAPITLMQLSYFFSIPPQDYRRRTETEVPSQGGNRQGCNFTAEIGVRVPAPIRAVYRYVVQPEGDSGGADARGRRFGSVLNDDQTRPTYRPIALSRPAAYRVQALDGWHLPHQLKCRLTKDAASTRRGSPWRMGPPAA